MSKGLRNAGLAVGMLAFGQVAMGAVVHANAPIAVPVDAPWAMAGLVGVITVVVIRYLKAGSK